MLIHDPTTVHQTYYEMTATDKQPLISESVMVTRIDTPYKGKNLTKMSYVQPPESHV
jgi:hypothetical protein